MLDSKQDARVLSTLSPLVDASTLSRVLNELRTLWCPEGYERHVQFRIRYPKRGQKPHTAHRIVFYGLCIGYAKLNEAGHLSTVAVGKEYEEQVRQFSDLLKVILTDIGLPASKWLTRMCKGLSKEPDSSTIAIMLLLAFARSLFLFDVDEPTKLFDAYGGFRPYDKAIQDDWVIMWMSYLQGK